VTGTSAADEETVQPAIVVTGGGEPTPAELAAIVVALTPVAVADEGAVGPDSRPSGWGRAALIEGVGGRPAVSRPDLVSGRFGLGRVGDPTLQG
jgi:hypothetical protein